MALIEPWIATRRPSPNYRSRQGTPVDRVVVHITDGGPDLKGCLDRLCDPRTRVAPHFVVGRHGEVFQTVSLEEAAFHAGETNQRSVGIEHLARTPGEIRAWGRLPLWERRLLVEDPAEAEAERDPGLALTAAQLDASADLVRRLLALLSLPLKAVVPHCELPGTTHSDCGLDVARGGIWPWESYRALLSG